MRALFIRACALAVVFFVATVPAVSQGIGMISGQVADESGLPIAGAQVTLSGKGILGTQSAVTDAEGYYRFRSVTTSDPVRLKASSPGRVAVEYVGHSARADRVVKVDFRLRAPGEHRVLVLIDESVPYHKVALEGALTTMPGHADIFAVADLGSRTVRALRHRLADKPSAVLAIGETAAKLARRQIRDVPVVHTMVPAPLDADLTTTNMCGVALNGAFDRQIEHVRHLVPDARRIATLYDPRRLDRCYQDLNEASRAAGIELVSSHLYTHDAVDLRAALENLGTEPIDAFVVLLDPGLIDAAAFTELTRFASSKDLVLAVPDAALTTPGKTFSFVPGFWDQGAFAGTLVRRILEEKVQPSEIGLVDPGAEGLVQVSARLETRSPGELLPDTIGESIETARQPEP